MDTTTQEQLEGYDVFDESGDKVGSVDDVWADDNSGRLEFISVKTGWILGKNHVVPLQGATFDHDSETITVSYPKERIKDAPAIAGDDDISQGQEDEIYAYYGWGGSSVDDSRDFESGTRTGTANLGTGNGTDDSSLTLSEEQLNVGKRTMETGRVRLRKVVNTEHVEQPVELRREDVEIERVAANDSDVPGDAFTEREVEVPVMQEEAVVDKEAHVTDRVRLKKDVHTDTETVGGDVRREEAVVDGADEDVLSASRQSR